jgi:hypothetical protein
MVTKMQGRVLSYNKQATNPFAISNWCFVVVVAAVAVAVAVPAAAAAAVENTGFPCFL